MSEIYCAREFSRAERIVKRGFDLLFASLFLLTVFPATCLILWPFYILERHSCAMFFVQRRTGYRGRTFNCIKFRTMRLSEDAHMKQATENDERVTGLGQFLRRTSIDEFPQFINVLLGQMSVAGPRPHMLHHTEKYSACIPYYMERHKVRPGITGYAQMRGLTGPTPEIADMERRVQADVEYINRHTFLLDCRLVGRTVFKVLGGRLHRKREYDWGEENLSLM
jgi:lipopolysaccharide/colanic/teichoic acid biosynthesis glycosyltransferase